MPQRVTFNGPLAWSAASLGVLVVALFVWGLPLLGTIFAPGAGVQEVGERFAVLMEEHEADQATYRDRFNGRSIFFTPRPRRTTPPPPPQPDDDPPRVVQPTIQPPPREYSGPSIRAIIGDEVWFHGELRLSPGEEGEGVKVISVNSPWSAKLEYARGEYEVFLFDPNTDALFGSGVASADPAGLVEVTPETPAVLEGGDAPPAEPGSESTAPTGGDDDEGGGIEEGGGEFDPANRAAQQGGDSPDPVKTRPAPVRSTSAET